MYNYISKIGNICFAILAGVLLISLLILTCNGGVFPEGFRKNDKVKNGLDVPLYYMRVTDRSRAYAKVTYNKMHAANGGAYEVRFTSSPEKDIGLKSTGFTFDKFLVMKFKAKADKPMTINVIFHHKNNDNILYSPIQLSTTWNSYEIKLTDIKQRTEKGDPVSDTLTKNDLGPYVEWSYPKTEKQTTGIFWIDDLEIVSVI